MSGHSIRRLGDVAEVVAGDPAPQDPTAFSHEGPLFVRMQDVGRNHLEPWLSDSSDRLSPRWLRMNRLRLFPAGSTLIPKSGASVDLNHRAKLAIDAYVVSHLAVVTPDRTKLDPEYLYWWSVQYDPRAQAQVTSLPSLKLSVLKDARLALPPLDEQRRIVAILNRAARIDRLRTRATERIREFVPALFVRMFGDPVRNPMGWPVEPIGEFLTNGPQNGVYRPKSDYGSGTPILRIVGFYDGRVSGLKTWKRVRLDKDTVSKYGLVEGDIVINRVNSRPFLGKSGLIPHLDEPAVFESNMMRLQVDRQRICPSFLIRMLQLESLRTRLCLNAKDAINQSSINQADVKSCLVLVPPLELQYKFCNAATKVHSLTHQAEAGRAGAATLSSALMAKLLS